MSKDTSTVLKQVIKYFFLMEVHCGLVMDSLFSGLRVLQSRFQKEETTANVLQVHVEEGNFVLKDDLFAMLEKVAMLELKPIQDQTCCLENNHNGEVSNFLIRVYNILIIN